MAGKVEIFNNLHLESDSEDEPTLGELVEVSKRVQSAELTDREDAFRAGHATFNPHRQGWVPKSMAKRSKKSRPREMSSKAPVPVGRDRCLGLANDFDRNRSVKRFDPRFEEHCGDLRDEHVERNYAFVQGLREKRRKELEGIVSKDRSSAGASEELRRMAEDDHHRKTILRRREILKNVRKEEKDAVKRGKRPYFLKEKDIRNLEMKAKFDDLKKSGGIKKYIEKRRRRIASKDKKLLPGRRGGD